MLAQRFAGLLPGMTDEEALEAAAIASLSGRFTPAAVAPAAICRSSSHGQFHRVGRRRLSAPARRDFICPLRGAVSRRGCPEFARSALETLREAAGDWAHHHRAGRAEAEFPARFQLVATMNPVPAAWGRASGPAAARPIRWWHVIRQRISGPLLDRIDLHVEWRRCRPRSWQRPKESSAAVQQRASAARDKALQRQGLPNHQLQGQLDTHLQLEPEALTFAHKAAARHGWSARGTHRALKVARTIADLADSDSITQNPSGRGIAIPPSADAAVMSCRSQAARASATGCARVPAD